jgi:Fur family ferric uptake transcriptional regulator
VLREANQFRSAQEVHRALHSHGERVGLSTVYRAVHALADSGDLDLVHTPEGETLYRHRQAAHHHHHLLCRRCRRSVEITHPTLHRWIAHLADVHGFRNIEHVLLVTGVCPDCA